MTEPARSFQHYEVLRRADGSPWELGRGAMGITYKAFDVNLCCEVALKVVNSALLDHPNARERFVREARAAAALRHRNVASVYHLGNDGEHFFYAMEFIDGETLDALIRQRGPMPVAAVLAVLLQVSKALVAAERQGLVHRDIKPANLMVVHEDGDDEMSVKVIDFGLARPVAGTEGAAQVTLGGFVGTPQYASPEQLEERPLDARSDIYSLGVTAWYLLTSTPPFAGSLAAVCQQQVSRPPPWERLPSRLPEAVRELLRRMLAKDPADRPSHARELRARIEGTLESLPAELRSATWESPVATDALRLNKLLAGRYLPTELLEENPGSKVYLATDEHHAGDPVVLRTVPTPLAANETEIARLRDEVRLVQAAAHPGLSEIYALEEPTTTLPAYLVEEARAGFSLRDLVAAHGGALPLDHVLQLLDRVAATADHAATCRLQGLDLGLHHIFVGFPYADRRTAGGPDSARSLRALPLSKWPVWTLKIPPLSVQPRTTESRTWTGGLTLTPGAGNPLRDSPRNQPGASPSYLPEVATLTAQLLGVETGTDFNGEHAWARRVRLPLVNEAGNIVWLKAMEGGSDYQTCRGFHAALADAVTAPGAVFHREPIVAPHPPVGPAATWKPAAVEKVATPLTTVADNYFTPAPTGSGTSSAWERLQIGRPDSGRPARWLLAIAAILVVFVVAFAVVLAFLLHGNPDHRPARTATTSPVAADTPAPVQPTPIPKPAALAAPPTPTVVPVSHTPPIVVVKAVPDVSPSATAEPMLAVHLVSRRRGAEVRWHGELLGSTPVDVRLPPGDQELVVRYPDGPETHQTVHLRADQVNPSVEIQPMRTDLLPLNNPPVRDPRGSPARSPFAPRPGEPDAPRVEPAVPVAPPPRRAELPVRRPSPLEPFRREAAEKEQSESESPASPSPNDHG